MKYVRVIDKNGLFIEDAFVEELTPFTIEEVCPQGFILPKWDFSNKVWVEGGIKPLPTPIEQTIEERVSQVEKDNAEIVGVLAEIVGVSV